MILSGKEVSKNIREIIKKEIEQNKLKPFLVVLEVGNNPSNKVYIKQKKKACENLGIVFKHHNYPSDVTEEELIRKIKELNKDEEVDAILLQLPISKHLNSKKIINTINPIKDVDGLTKFNMDLLKNNKETIVPCTPLGIIDLLDYYSISLKNKKVVIMGKSLLVGEPLYNILKNKNINVEIVDEFTENIKKITKTADILVVAIGKKHLIDKSYVKKDVVIIDVGITKENEKIYGDVNPEVYEIASSYTPVPGGVGVMTVTELLKNVLKCYKNRRNNENNI